jgi:zinc transport system ATP-binding protein
MEKAIEVNNLSFGYNENKIFDSVSFSVDKGDYLGIIGPNGSGKSTLIRLMLNMISPMKGEIILLGHNVKYFPYWSKVGYISQKANAINISFPATVEEILKANVNICGRQGITASRKAFLKEKIYHALEIVGMEDYGNELIGNLSGGQQQRVFIARMLVNEPEIMFLDEPTSARWLTGQKVKLKGLSEKLSRKGWKTGNWI